MKTLNDLFQHTLEDVYYAEKQIHKSLPDVIDAASNKTLQQDLKDHRQETKEQISLLEKTFESIGKKAKGEKCDAIEGLIKECEGVIKEASSVVARDAGIVACCQAIEHYEIARYGTLREWAKQLGEAEAHDYLTQILDQEKAANHKLTHLALSAVNTRGTKSNKK